MKKVITSFNFLPVAMGKTISCTYSEINSNGDIVKENVRETFIIIDDGLEKNVDSIIEFLNNRIKDR